MAAKTDSFIFRLLACSWNYINVLSVKQLNTLGNVSLPDIFLSTANVVEPHTHQNASELVYCISGAALVSLINPFTKELLYFQIQPGQTANVPQGWWHYEMALVDHTHLLVQSQTEANPEHENKSHQHHTYGHSHRHKFAE